MGRCHGPVGEVSWPDGAGWHTLTLRRAVAVSGDVPAPVSTLPAAPRGGDYDADDDGLIEIRSLAQLNAIRLDLDGDGDTPLPEYSAVFPGAMAGMGCTGDCTGYELAADLNFDTTGNGRADAGDADWNEGEGWAPIGTPAFPFTATFDGNGRTIANLYIDRGDTQFIGLFGVVSSNGGLIKNVSLVDVDLTGGNNLGALVGTLIAGSVRGSSVAGGSVVGGGDFYVGGLVGFQRDGASVVRSSAAVDVTGVYGVGGLVGGNGCCVPIDGGPISSSYATGSVTGVDQVGGLVGQLNLGSITSSSATGNVTGRSNLGALVGLQHGASSIATSQGTGSVTDLP